MMSESETLVAVVQRRLSEQEAQNLRQLAAPELVEAMRLADIFEHVKPKEEVLPLDAMAGFPIAVRAPAR